jgi:hypothetical protein
MSYVIKQIYHKYFQKSRSFLLPVLGLKKAGLYVPMQSYMSWENMYKTSDYNLILTYNTSNTYEWEKYLVETLMTNKMFNEYHLTDDPSIIALSFDLNCIAEDYDYILQGKYSKLSKVLKKKIRDYYNYNSAEWAYMESFLFPDNYIPLYGKILDVDEEHIRFTGELCDLPNLDKETLKIKPYAKINDVDQINMESRKDLQIDSNQS